MAEMCVCALVAAYVDVGQGAACLSRLCTRCHGPSDIHLWWLGYAIMAWPALWLCKKHPLPPSIRAEKSRLKNGVALVDNRWSRGIRTKGA